MTGNSHNGILLKELKIYQWIFSLFGLNLPTFLLHRSEKDIKYYIVLSLYLLYSLLILAIAIWNTYTHNLIVYRATLRHSLDTMTETITYMQNIIIALLHILMSYKAWCCHQKLLEILLLFNKLEQKCLKMCPDIFKNQNLNLRKTLLHNTGTGLAIVISSVLYFNYQLVADDMYIRDKVFFAYFMVALQLKFLEYGTYVQLIAIYLKIVLQSLKYIKINVDNEVERSVSLTSCYRRKIKLNRELLMEILGLIYELERYFAWPIFQLFFYNGLVILCAINWAYVQYLYETTAIYQWFRLGSICAVSFNMLLLCYLTQKCINEYQHFSHVLHNFKLYAHDVQMIMAIKEYALQLMHQPILFTCNGYMNIDLNYYGKICLVILAYSVILLQFKLTDISEGVVRATKLIFRNMKSNRN